MSKMTPPMGKEKSEKTLPVLTGGKTKMFGKGGAAPMPPGVTAQPSQPTMNKGPIKGGPSGVMGKQRSSAPARPGVASPGGHSAVDNTFGVKGGKGHMAGHTGSTPAKPR